MQESAANTAQRRDPQVHQESDKQVVEGEKEAFWRERFREANTFAYEVETRNHDLQFEVDLLKKQLAYVEKRLDSAIEWWEELKLPERMGDRNDR
jgi:hypothetical protein